MKKTVLTTIMKQTRLRNNFLKYRSGAMKRACKAQRNICVSLMRKAKQKNLDNIDHKTIVDNKTFYKTDVFFKK